ncbi:MFS transporter [Rhodococcus pyridinivorans]|uniref:MFS transporter n=1 Tax=Rhodococcus pyridinivorans TaxID=103816 RepID=UPI002283A702|nr:MFS transporter [Rhodococcus pyridinivorans]WAL46032.1 MFS transporter [Rhodococcus pyridinivorans]
MVTEHTATASPTRQRSASPAVLIPSMCLVVMITAIMQTAVVPLMPVIVEQLDAGVGPAGWIITANLLAATVSTPLLGRLADRRGPRTVLLGVLAVVFVGSLLCVAWDSLPVLIAGRALQGVSFALFPIGVAVLRSALGSHRLPTALGIMSGMMSVGGGLGMIAAGLLYTDGDDYREIFWLLVVLVVLATAVAWFVVPRSPGSGSGGGTDFGGAVGLTLGLSCLLLALAQGGAWGWLSLPTVGCALFGVIVLLLWYRHEQRSEAPLVAPALLTGRSVAPAHLAAFLVGIAMFVQFLAIAMFVQADPHVVGYGFGASVLETSLFYLMPGQVVGVTAAVVSGFLVRRFRADRVLAVACGIGVCGFGFVMFFHDHTWQMIIAVAVLNTFVSAAYGALPAMLVDHVPMQYTGVANGINAIARTFGSSLASALVGSLLATVTVAGSDLASAQAYVAAFAVGGATTLAAGLVALSARFWQTTNFD